MPLLPRTQELDIIQWWQHAGLKYPTLRKIARDVLAIPVTTVASESVFSTSGRIISPHRSRLAPSMVEALMCMQAWSQADMLGKCNFYKYVVSFYISYIINLWIYQCRISVYFRWCFDDLSWWKRWRNGIAVICLCIQLVNILIYNDEHFSNELISLFLFRRMKMIPP